MIKQWTEFKRHNNTCNLDWSTLDRCSVAVEVSLFLTGEECVERVHHVRTGIQNGTVE